MQSQYDRHNDLIVAREKNTTSVLMCAVSEQGYSLWHLTVISISRHADRQAGDVKP